MKLWAVEHFFHHFWVGVGVTANPDQSDDKYVQLPRVSLLFIEVTSYKIHTLVLCTQMFYLLFEVEKGSVHTYLSK